MAIRGAKVAVAMARCEPFETETKINNGAADIAWAKTPIYLVERKDMADFVCKHPYWLKIDEVYKNVPDQKPTCG